MAVDQTLLSAYKTNPLVTGLFILNILSISGAGYFLNESDRRNIDYLRERDKDVQQFRTMVLTTVSHCIVPKGEIK